MSPVPFVWFPHQLWSISLLVWLSTCKLGPYFLTPRVCFKEHRPCSPSTSPFHLFLFFYAYSSSPWALVALWKSLLACVLIHIYSWDWHKCSQFDFTVNILHVWCFWALPPDFPPFLLYLCALWQWLIDSSDSPASSWMLGWHVCNMPISLFFWCWWWNPGPHSCEANALPLSHLPFFSY